MQLLKNMLFWHYITTDSVELEVNTTWTIYFLKKIISLVDILFSVPMVTYMPGLSGVKITRGPMPHFN